MTEITRRMAYRIRGIDPWTKLERRRIEIDRYVKMCRYEMMLRGENRIRRMAELAIARAWSARHPEAGKIALPAEGRP